MWQSNIVLKRKVLRVVFSILIFIGLSANVNAEKLVFVKSSEQDFSHPHDLVFFPKTSYLYVSDMNNHVIKVLDPNTLEVLSIIGEGELSAPHDVAIDHMGRLLVADSGNHRVVIYQLNGLKANIVGEIQNNMLSPEGVTSDNEGNLYVANAGNNLILKYKSGKLLKKSGGSGSVTGKFDRAHDIEYFQGKLFIGDPGNNRIQVLDEELNFVKIIQAAGKSFNEPKYLGLDKLGRLYIADQHNDALRVFDETGKESHRVNRAGDKSFDRIEGVEINEKRVWVSDTYNDRIVLFHWKN